MSVVEVSGGAMLPPADFGEKPLTRRTKGTPYTNGGTGMALKFNIMPPGQEMNNQPFAEDVKRIEAIPINTTPILK